MNKEKTEAYEEMLKAYYHDLAVLTDQISAMQERIESVEVRKLRNIEQEEFYHKCNVYQEMRLEVVSSIEKIEKIVNNDKGEQKNDKQYHNHRKMHQRSGVKIT